MEFGLQSKAADDGFVIIVKVQILMIRTENILGGVLRRKPPPGIWKKGGHV